jgi:hypothetical protein
MDEMTQKLPFGVGSFNRRVAKTPELPLHNRFIEQVPALTDGPATAISRPGMRFLSTAGSGPMRGMFTAPGIFGEKAFIVNGTGFYTVDPTTGVQTQVALISSSPEGDVSWAAIAQIDAATPSRLFFAEGQTLWVYSENSEAWNTLQVTSIANGDVVEIQSVYYEFTNSSVDAGTPAGTVGAPWLVALGANTAEAIRNLAWAINAENGTEGVEYSTATVTNPNAVAYNFTSTDLFVAAKIPGVAGNAYTTTETGANMAWNSATMQGGGTTRVRQVPMPDDVGAISVDEINGFVIVVPVQSEEDVTTGTFYWIEPGALEIDPINFANAERSSDNILQVKTFRDQFWLFGSKTIESWIVVGDINAPMQRYQGVLVDRGSWEGTALKIKDSLIWVDEEGGVFRLQGAGGERISRPDIEERIRRGILAQGLTS